MYHSSLGDRKNRKLAIVNLTIACSFCGFVPASPAHAECSPAPSGLVAWYAGENGTADTSGTGNDAAPVGLVTYAPGKVGSAFDFLRDNNTYPEAPHSDSLALTSGVTLAAWVNPRAQTIGNGGDLAGVVTKWGQSALVDSYGMWLLNTPEGYVNCGAIGGTDFAAFCGGEVPLGTWSFVTTTYDADSGVQSVFVNGVQVASRVYPGGINPGVVNLQIGNEHIANRPFDGQVDEVQVFNRALSASEITSIYAAGSDGLCPVGGESTIQFVSTRPANKPARFRARETAGTIVVKVQRTGSGSGAASATIALTPKTATAGVDYDPSPVIVTWDDGELGVKSVSVSVTIDGEVEPAESFGGSIADTTNAAIGSRSRAILVIRPPKS